MDNGNNANEKNENLKCAQEAVRHSGGVGCLESQQAALLCLPVLKARSQHTCVVLVH